MPKYTYTFIDIRSQQKLGTLPLYGVNCTDLLLQGAGGASAGTFTGSIRMDSDFATVDEILEITRPEATMIWMERDDTAIWCGILWTRTYQSDGRVLQLNAQTFSSYLSKVVWDPLSGVETYSLLANPHNMVRYLWRYLETEASEEYDVGVRREQYHEEYDPVAQPDKFITFDFVRAEHKALSEYASDALKAGGEYRIVPLVIDGIRTPQYQSGFPGTLGVTQDGAARSQPFQYPGDISKYWLTNSVSNAPTKLIGVGKSTGQDGIYTVQQGSTANRIGVDDVVSYETQDQTTLVQLTANDLLASQQQLNRPVYELNGANVDFGWGLGDYKYIIIDDPYRFGGPVGGYVRLVGWTLSPADSGSLEQQGITIDNASNLVALSV
jgi:hypothetical protein